MSTCLFKYTWDWGGKNSAHVLPLRIVCIKSHMRWTWVAGRIDDPAQREWKGERSTTLSLAHLRTQFEMPSLLPQQRHIQMHSCIRSVVSTCFCGSVCTYNCIYYVNNQCVFLSVHSYIYLRVLVCVCVSVRLISFPFEMETKNLLSVCNMRTFCLYIPFFTQALQVPVHTFPPNRMDPMCLPASQKISICVANLTAHTHSKSE